MAFRGRGYEHAVVLDEGTQINSIFSDVRIERGRAVGLRLDLSGCLVFSASAAGATVAPDGGTPGEAGSETGGPALAPEVVPVP